MNKERCKICNSEQMTTDDVRGEKSCEECGYVIEQNQLDNASWSPGEFDPDHESRRPVPMTPEQRTELRNQGARQAFDPFQAAGGGIAKQAGDPSGAPPERGPNSQGLPGLLKRVRNY